jgi:predicted RNA-binding protein YlxR (DUF448 family)
MQPGYRRCISCGKIAPKSDFWRVVKVYPSQAIQLDQGMGRSAYLCRQEDCIRSAQKKKRLERNLKTQVDKELYQLLLQQTTLLQSQM